MVAVNAWIVLSSSSSPSSPHSFLLEGLCLWRVKLKHSFFTLLLFCAKTQSVIASQGLWFAKFRIYLFWLFFIYDTFRNKWGKANVCDCVPLSTTSYIISLQSSQSLWMEWDQSNCKVISLLNIYVNWRT